VARGRPGFESSAGTASVHLYAYPSALSLLRRRYCAIYKPLFIFYFVFLLCCRHAPTYETATTRRFYHARTETVRSCSPEACQWCVAMDNKAMPVSLFIHTAPKPNLKGAAQGAVCVCGESLLHR
jgi:hypothetical protein